MSDELALDAFRILAENDPAAATKVLTQVRKKLYVPHNGGQREVHASEARFRIIRAGRRWGKTKLAANELIMKAINKPDSMNWWVANTYKNVRRGYREVLRQLPTELLAKPAPSSQSNELILQFKNGARIEFYSGGNPDALAGEGVNFVVVDEAALIPEHVWFQLIRPTLMDTGGSGLIISTPRGRNWFWKLWNYGQRSDRPGYESWHFPQTSNPYVPQDETDEAQDTMPDILFRQEIMAEFVSSNASIFNFADDRIAERLAQPYGHVYVGIDLGKKEDYTVITASRAHDRRPCYHEKLNTTRWPDQEAAIVEAIRELERTPGVEAVTAGIDATGIGDVVFDHLDEHDIDLMPIAFSNPWKKKAVTLLAADLEKDRAFILPEQVEEFETYEYTITDNGRYVFEAATGHDDEVSAKLLEHWVMEHEGPPGVLTADLADEAEYELEEWELDTSALEDVVEQEIAVPDSAAAIMANPAAWA